MPSATASIVICTLNRPDDIQRCVATIARQTQAPKQLIVVDAGELGEVRDRLRALCQAKGIEFLYFQDKPSTTAQRNLGAEHATGDVVFFMDDDVELDDGYLANVLSIYDRDNAGEIGGVTGVLKPDVPASTGFWHLFERFFCLAETRQGTGTRLKNSNFPVHATRLSHDVECEFMPSTAVSYRLAVFNQFRFDRDLTGYVMAEDIDLSFRVSRKYKLLMTPTAVYGHSKSKVSRNSPREQEKRRILFTQYFFCKNLGTSWTNRLVRLWALAGLAIRYFFQGLRHGNLQRFLGLWDGIVASGRNGLLAGRSFEPGPLQH